MKKEERRRDSGEKPQERKMVVRAGRKEAIAGTLLSSRQEACDEHPTGGPGLSENTTSSSTGKRASIWVLMPPRSDTEV